jgi:hypothetical protein
VSEVIYLWRVASDCPNRMIVVHDKGTVEPTLFRKTVPFDGVVPVRFSHKGTRAELREQHYLPNSANLPLVSCGAGVQLKSLVGDSLQIVPAIIECSDGGLDASLVNPLKSIPGVDWADSKALFLPGTKQVMKFTKLQLLPQSMDGLHLARLDEFRPFILASESVRNLFDSSELCEFNLPYDVGP